jgi:tetratricopeptide (TPR) repeat protein
MKTFIIYLVLFAFYFMSLSPSGLSLQTVLAFDDFGGGDTDDFDSFFEDPEPSSGDSFGFDEDPLPPISSTPQDSYESSSFGKKIAYLYLYADSYSEGKATNLTAETASFISNISDFDFVQSEASLFVPAMSAAQRDFERGVDLFKEAKELYEDLLIEDAISKFRQALAILERNLDKLPELKMISDILLYLGASYRMLDEDEMATPFFNSYISINPIAELDDIIFSPEIVSFYNRIKDDHLMLPTGTMVFESYPSGAFVFINGKIAGVTPLRLDGIPKGTHYYRIHKTGYRSRAGKIDVRERRDTRINENLQAYSEATYIEIAKEDMAKQFGRLSMLRKANEVAEKLNVDEIVVTMVAAEGERIKYSGVIVNREKRNFKMSSTEFEMPFDGNMGRVYEVEIFHSDMFHDKFGFRPISDVALDEAKFLGIGEDQPQDGEGKKEKSGGGSKWWLWTILGVVVLGGAGVGTYFIVTETSKSKGAELEINF